MIKDSYQNHPLYQINLKPVLSYNMTKSLNKTVNYGQRLFLKGLRELCYPNYHFEWSKEVFLLKGFDPKLTYDDLPHPT